jgi:hypothetical protein
MVGDDDGLAVGLDVVGDGVGEYVGVDDDGVVVGDTVGEFVGREVDGE